MRATGAAALLEMLANQGVRYLFGNPGTSELPLLDAMATDKRIEYVLGLQEVPVMAMADGYSMASGKLGVVNLHISCGLGNAMGILYNAFREGTPLLVTAGQQDRRLAFEEPILYGDMVAVAKPWTKWSAEVGRVEDLPSAIRRAVQTALTPPTGPVFLSLPMDIQSEVADLDVSLSPLPDAQIRPPRAAIERAAAVLAEAKNPAILCGSRIVEQDAVAELVALAETLAAPVISEPGTTHGRLGFQPDHPLYALGLQLWSPEIRERLKPYDVLFVAGTDLLRQYVYHEPSRALPEHLRVVHLDQDPWQLGKNYPTEVGVISHLKTGLSELAAELRNVQSDSQRQTAGERAKKIAAEHEAARKALWKRAEKEQSARPMTPLGLMSTLAKVLPPDLAVIEEAVTTTNTYFERLGALRNPTGYFGHRGWSLGWGLGCSIGVKLAWPDRPVLAMLGEGAAMYGIQGLWTAARRRIPVTFVICNNAQYGILKAGAQMMKLPEAQRGKYVGLDLDQPEVDLVGIARSFGVKATRIAEPEELAEAVSSSLRGDEPQLIDVPILREPPTQLHYG